MKFLIVFITSMGFLFIEMMIIFILEVIRENLKEKYIKEPDKLINKINIKYNFLQLFQCAIMIVITFFIMNYLINHLQ